MKKTKQKKISAFDDLYNLLTNTRKKLYLKQLHDGSAYVYDRHHLLASFRYYGGTSLIDLRLNTRHHIGKTFYNKLHMGDYLMSGGDKLKALLKQLFPDAHLCNPNMKHAYEYSIVEATLLDTTTMIEVTGETAYKFDVAMVNVDGFVSCSFRYLKRTGYIRNLYLRYSSMRKTIRLEDVRVPEYRRHLFMELLERELTPIT